ncbi:MAG: hypothetical protein ACP5I6_02410 [Caldisphaera sp.]|jgi:hypothetical protein|nr:DUF447 family protein [Caldisphaera sp.]PMP89228.1 MAG: hypothetical protein C0172_00630 [Caldisphaera sp.]
MKKGIYYEFIAFLCDKAYAMPLGILYYDKPIFYVYKSTTMAKLLNLNKDTSNSIYLLSPNDPTLFLESLEHRIENRIIHNNKCLDFDDKLGSWYYCNSYINKDHCDKYEFYCDNFYKIKGENIPYSRSYGCLIELLILLTKVKAGIKEQWFLNYASGLKWCVERSSNKDEKYVELSEKLLQMLRKHLEES